MPPFARPTLIAGSVVLLHAAALWALQTGLLRRSVEVVVPVQRLDAALVEPPKVVQPAAEPPAPVPPSPKPPPKAAPKPAPRKAPAVARKAPPAPPAPQPVALPDSLPAPAAATGTPDPQPTPPPVSVPVAATPAPAAARAPAPAAAARVELPISDADYLHNPPPKWPRLSERLGERGRVVVRVLIGTDGRAKKAEVKESSGYQRLDDASVEAVLSWRYVPGKRGGVPEEMWVLVPIRWGG